MKKFFLFLLFLFPFSAFAWTDTDKMCTDSNKNWHISESIHVAYPGENVFVNDVWKVYAPNPKNGLAEWIIKLYYVVTVVEKDWTTNNRSELYSYNCTTKTPELLLNLLINKAREEYYHLDFMNSHNLVLTWRASGIGWWSIATIIGFDTSKNTTFLTYKSNYLDWGNEGDITGLVNGKTAWYLYYSPQWRGSPDKIYSVSKKTKKLTEL